MLRHQRIREILISNTKGRDKQCQSSPMLNKTLALKAFPASLISRRQASNIFLHCLEEGSFSELAELHFKDGILLQALAVLVAVNGVDEACDLVGRGAIKLV